MSTIALFGVVAALTSQSVADVPAIDCVKPAMFYAVNGTAAEDIITVKIGLMLPLDMAALKESFGYAISASAVTMALERVRQERLLDAVSWEFVWYWPQCVESWASGIASTLFATHYVDVIIGPPCSIAAIVAGHMGKFYDVPLIGWAASSPELNDRSRFPTTARTVPSGLESPASQHSQCIGIRFRLGEAVFETLMFFDWRRYALLYSDDAMRRKCHYFQQGFEAKSIAQHAADAGNHMHVAFKMTIEDDADAYERTVEAFLDALPSKARSAMNDLPLRFFGTRVHQRGLDTDEYVYILPDYLPSQSQPDIWVDYSVPADGLDQAALSAMRKSLVIYMEQIADVQLDQFKRAVPKKMKEWPYCYNRHPLPLDERYGSTFSPYMYDATYLYAIALNKTLDQGLSKRNGSIITQNMIGLQFEGKSGVVSMNKYASREESFVIMGLNASNKLITFGTLEVNGIDAMTFMRRMKLNQPASIIWASRGGVQPSWRPRCGFENNCQTDTNLYSNEYVVMVIAAFLTVIGILVIILLFLSYRFRKGRESWRIMAVELKKLDQTARNSIMSIGSTADSDQSIANSPSAFEFHYYRGNLVDTIERKNVKGSLDTRELNAMVSLDNDNVNGFLGICVSVSTTVYCVWRHCANGTLQAVLRKYTHRLDQFFLLSLIRDLVHGIDYLHQSVLGYHGRLTSFNCLIDHRWQLKVCDFGPRCVSRPLGRMENPQELLWTAPELLRTDEPPPQKGMQKADMYSIGILLSEILSANTAYSNVPEATSAAEIIYRVRLGGQNPMRPQVNVPAHLPIHTTLMPIMYHCWDEDPAKRPTIHPLKSVLKRMMKGESGTLMDHVMTMTEKYAGKLEQEVAERTRELAEAQHKSDELLHRMLPLSIAEQLKAGVTVPPEQFDDATIFFSDVVGFTVLASRSTPMQLVALLSDLYTTFDDIVNQHDVYKVETIGDGYLVVSGLPHRNGDKHASEVADLALSFMRAVAFCRVPHLPNERMQLRIGIHSGPTVAGVVGSAMPRYCLFGDSVNTASRMESHGQPGYIQITENTNRYLTTIIGGYKTEERGEILIKGKGTMTTFWLLGKQE